MIVVLTEQKEGSNLKWQEGRQGGGYLKLPIVMTRFPIPWDLHVLKIPKGSVIKEHTDPVPGYNMYRINVILKQPKAGGEFKCANTLINWPRLKYFRPDIEPHSVTRVEDGERLVLSIGWCFRK